MRFYQTRGSILFRLLVLRDKQPVKFAISVIAQLLCYRRGMALDAQKLKFLWKLHDLIWGQQIAPRDDGADCWKVTRFAAIRLIADSLLSHCLTDPLDRLKIIDAKHYSTPAFAMKVGPVRHRDREASSCPAR